MFEENLVIQGQTVLEIFEGLIVCRTNERTNMTEGYHIRQKRLWQKCLTGVSPKNGHHCRDWSVKGSDGPLKTEDEGDVSHICHDTAFYVHDVKNIKSQSFGTFRRTLGLTREIYQFNQCLCNAWWSCWGKFFNNFLKSNVKNASFNFYTVEETLMPLTCQ